MWMFDTRVADRAGGSGLPFDWSIIQSIAIARAIVISGGLTPGNVADCVRAVRPYAVDVRSGIETDGRKDAAKMAAFVAGVHEADTA
jgi:phosphoribosylanthranilate isomerase